MTALLQISDTHFGTERTPVVTALVQLAREQQPDVVVLSGDITQRARPVEFEAARRFVEQLGPMAVLTIPGNHDIPLFNLAARVFTPYANYMLALGNDLEPIVEMDRLLVLGVNTTRPRRHKNGELSRAQIQRIADRLRCASSSQLRVVVVHQPVLAISPSDETNVLRGSEEAVPVWAAAGCDIILGGHIHLPYMRSLRTRFKNLPRDVWTVQAGTAVSSRLRAGIDNSVNLIRRDATEAPRECVVERWDFVPSSSNFELHSSQRLQFDVLIDA